MGEGDQDKPKRGTDPDATVTIVGKRLFQTTDEATIRRLENIAADLATEEDREGIEKPGGVGVMGPDLVKDRNLEDDDDAPVAG